MRAAIVLAAGRSRRFGTQNKLLVRFQGRPLLHHALAVACAAPVGRVLLVVGRDVRVGNYARAFGDRRVTVVSTRESVSRRQSLAAALRCLLPREREVLVFLADMPLVAHDIARRMAYRVGLDATAARPAWRGKPGHPVLLRDPGDALRRLENGEPPFDPRSIEEVSARRTSIFDIDRPGALDNRKSGG